MTDIDFGKRQCVVRAALPLVGPVSVRASWRAVAVVAVLLVGAAVAAIVAIGIGKYSITPVDVLRVLAGTNSSFDRVVVLQWRMPLPASATSKNSFLSADVSWLQNSGCPKVQKLRPGHVHLLP